jgi:hypothetical protein
VRAPVPESGCGLKLADWQPWAAASLETSSSSASGMPYHGGYIGGYVGGGTWPAWYDVAT